MLQDKDIRLILDREIESAVGYMGGELESDREKARDFYLGEATGDLAPPDGEGRSSVVSTDVADVVEWVLPQLLKTFTQSDDAVRFDPESEEDEEQAEQESDYVSYVFNKENNGFLILYSWFKDALTEKNGYVKTFWDEAKKTAREEYQGLTDIELAMLYSDPECELVEHTAYLTEDGVELHDVVCKRTETKGKACVLNTPPDEVLVNSDHTSVYLTNARFVAHEVTKTSSELVEMGIDRDVVSDLPSYDEDPDESRNTVEDEYNDQEPADRSQRLIRLYECYPLIDMDEDGISERWRFLYCKGVKILEQEEADGVPFSCLTPYIQPHRHIGRGVWDRIKEIQKQKTAIWRNILDNFYLQNNQMVEAVQNQVNLDDLLVRRPGGVVRTKNPGMVNAIRTEPIGVAAFQVLEKLDQMREERSGVGPNMMGQNIDLSNDTAHGIERLMTAKEELVGLIARVFGETGVKDMFLKIRELLAKHQDKEKVVKLRNKWVPVNPSEWRERVSSTIKVGLGTGDRMKQIGALTKVLEYQKEIVTHGGTIVTEKNIYNALQDLSKAGGLNDADPYFTDPENIPPRQPKPDPTEQMLQLQAQIEQQNQQLRRMKDQMDHHAKMRDLERKEQELIHKMQKEMTELELEAGRDLGEEGVAYEPV